jgi:hypothetical protein
MSTTNCKNPPAHERMIAMLIKRTHGRSIRPPHAAAINLQLTCGAADAIDRHQERAIPSPALCGGKWIHARWQDKAAAGSTVTNV